MVAEAEKFASEDEAQRKRIEPLNLWSSFVYGLKTQLGDQEVSGLAMEEAKRNNERCCKDLGWERGEEEGDLRDYGDFH